MVYTAIPNDDVVITNKNGVVAYTATEKEVKFKDAVRHNKMYYKSALKNPIRKKFFKDLSRLPFDKVIKKYGWGLL